MALGAACSAPGEPALSVAVTVTPNPATVVVRQTQAFAAHVTGSPNTQVNWSVQEGATGGSVSPAGLYTAPTSPGLYHLVAAPVAEPQLSTTVPVTVTVDGAQLALAPTSAQVALGASQQFTAQFTGGSGPLVWSVVEAHGGEVTPQGMYTAPNIAGTYHVVVKSAVDAAISATAVVTASGAPIQISPVGATLSLDGGTQTFVASGLDGGPASVTWSVAEQGGGGVTSGGVYTVPQAQGVYHVVATSVADPTQVASVPVNVTLSGTPVSVTVSPLSPSLPVSTPYQRSQLAFSATVANAAAGGVLWSTTSGSIDTNGVLTAGPGAGSFTVTAASAADPTAYAQTSVTLTPVLDLAPVSATVATGGTLQLIASDYGLSDNSVTWSVDGGTGTISVSGLYTAPSTPPAGPVVVTAQASNGATVSATLAVAPGVSGYQVLHHVMDTGTLDRPGDLSTWVIGAYAPDGGGYAYLPATVTGNTFFIPGLSSSTPYLLYAQSPDQAMGVVGTAKSWDLSSAVLGRADEVVAGPGTDLVLDATLGQAFGNLDDLQLESAGAGVAYGGFTFLGLGLPGTGGTLLSEEVPFSPFGGLPVVTAEGDVATLHHLAGSQPGADYAVQAAVESLVWSGAGVGGLDMVNGQPTTASGVFKALPQNQALKGTLHRESFNALLGQLGQGVDAGLVYQVTVDGVPGGGTYGNFSLGTPDALLVQAAPTPTTLALNVAFGNPFPSSYALYGTVLLPFSVSYPAPASGFPSVTVSDYALYSDLWGPFQSHGMSPLVGVPTNIQINGAPFSKPPKWTSGPVTLSWSPPAGAPAGTFYKVTFVDASLGASFQFLTSATQFVLPAQFVAPAHANGDFCLFTLSADVGIPNLTAPLTLGFPQASAPVYSGWFAP
jgi:hypothetical protein